MRFGWEEWYGGTQVVVRSFCHVCGPFCSYGPRWFFIKSLAGFRINMQAFYLFIKDAPSDKAFVGTDVYELFFHFFDYRNVFFERIATSSALYRSTAAVVAEVV